ncbi:hypothetical protein [Kitasatospora sp. NPDC002965]|uniref:hypothetical protein n=1 Tax=Kitasatospora sp. NPDC002965 TaxID=3154775 RepID=UPI0033A19055
MGLLSHPGVARAFVGLALLLLLALAFATVALGVIATQRMPRRPDDEHESDPRYRPARGLRP